jgi:hypothetical protein
MPKNFKTLLEEAHKIKMLAEAPPEEDEMEDEPIEDDEDADLDMEDPDAEEGEEDSIDSLGGDGDTDYTADDIREIIDYVYDILDKEDDGELNDSVGEIGLDLIYDYADAFPQTVLNQIVEDLKEIFEIEDTMLESIVTEGAVFVKKKKGQAAKAAAKKSRQYYKKNKGNLKKRNKSWRKSAIGKKLIALHKKMMKKMGKAKKGKRLVSAPADVTIQKG